MFKTNQIIKKSEINNTFLFSNDWSILLIYRPLMQHNATYPAMLYSRPWWIYNIRCNYKMTTRNCYKKEIFQNFSNENFTSKRKMKMKILKILQLMLAVFHDIIKFFDKKFLTVNKHL